MSVRACRSSSLILFVGLLGWMLPSSSQARNLTVGPGRMYATIRGAAQACQAGDTVSVDPGTYTGDVSSWTKPNLVIRAANPANKPHLVANGQLANSMGVFHVSPGATSCTIDGFNIEGARSPTSATGNACGIRVEAGNPGWVAIRNCYLHNNELNIMAAPDSLLVEYCELSDTPPTTTCDPTCRVGNQHNIYVNTGGNRVCMFRYNYSHDTATGQLFKSRGRTSYVMYNRLTDENGTGSYAVDISDGGRAYVIGNIIEQGPNSENSGIVSFAAESGGNGTLDLYVVNNTIVNDRSGGTFVTARAGTTAKVMNNIFCGPGTPMSGTTFVALNNYQDANKTSSWYRNPAAYDYHLTSNAPGSILDAGAATGTSVTGFLLTPTREYVYDEQGQARTVTGALDLGAFEYGTGGGGGTDVSAPAAVKDLRYR